MSSAFADHLRDGPEPLGAHDLEGLDERVRIYRPGRV
jgi:hypothetical protein